MPSTHSPASPPAATPRAPVRWVLALSELFVVSVPSVTGVQPWTGLGGAPFWDTMAGHGFGNFRDLVIGMWGGLDLMVDPYSGSTSGTVRIVALQDVDVAVRYTESFATMVDALTA